MPSGRLQDYEVLGMIGSGSYGICKKIRRRKDNKMLVWKELDYGKMSDTEKQMLVSEVNLLRELKHPHIVRYYDRIIDRTNTTIYIVMEFCEGGDLGALIKKHKREKCYVSEDFVWKLLYQLVLAVQECHRRKDGAHVLHRDLKPANVFLDSSMNVKLGDFGLARVLSHDTSFAKTFVGTPYYMSPEQVNKMSYNAKSDIWSLGCLVYELCALSPPFTAMNQNRLEDKIKIGRFHPIPSRYSQSLSQVINSMLQVNDDMRPSIEELLRNPQLSRMQRENAASAQNNSGDKEESLRRWEKSLSEKEKDIERREKMLADRERLITEREEKCSRLEVESRHHYNGVNENLIKRTHPNYYHNLGMEKENDGDLLGNAYKRRYGYEKDHPIKLEHEDVFTRPMFPAPRLTELGYRNPNIAGGNVRVARLLSGLR